MSDNECCTTVEALEDMMHRSLNHLGYDLADPQIRDTPARWAEMMMSELHNCAPFQFTKFANENPKIDQMILESHIPVYSLCAHHVIPFFGIAHVAYIPVNLIAGLSKIARTVEHYSKCLTTQESITQNVLNRIVKELQPLGVMVVLECRHLCMEMRGVQKPGTVTMTSALWGVFMSSPPSRDEFLSLIRRNHDSL